ncbi:MAG: hypothetical protein Q9188_004700 [Gyalolechia gomerana]
MSMFHSPKRSGTQTAMVPVQQGSEDGHSRWIPHGPEIENVMILGYVDAPDHPVYSRDIGRSFSLDGRIYIMYGDTFCNDAGVSSNTYQVIPDRAKPRDAYYLSGDANGYVYPLINLDEEEVRFLNLPDNEGKRIAFWCFGGVVEITDGVGWTWYQKHIISQGGDSVLAGVGIARISHDKNTYSGELSSARMPGLMFGPHEPLFGSFAALLDGDMVYLWGQIGTDVFLARARKEACQQRHMYQFWNGRKYVPDMKYATPVLQDYQQGQFFRSSLFGPELAWQFVGVTKWADSMVMLGSASRLEGPWDIRPLFKAQGIKKPNAYQYCMYAHPWFAEQSRDKLLVSWCDPWPGGVIMAEVRFKTNPRIHWAVITLGEYVAYAAVRKAAEVCRVSNLQSTELYNPHRLQLIGIDQRTVDRALEMVRHQMGLAGKEVMSQAGGSQMQRIRSRGTSFSERVVNLFRR